jgi:ferredoxin
VTRKCCRSSPRCATCPARVSAAARKPSELGEPAALVAEIVGGRPTRDLPQSVAAALANLELARTAR